MTGDRDSCKTCGHFRMEHFDGICGHPDCTCKEFILGLLERRYVESDSGEVIPREALDDPDPAA